MALIVLSNAKLAYGHVDLLANTSFTLEEGERVGLIGRNGAGKSSLLKIFAEMEKPDDGLLQKQQNIRITYVAQEPIFESNDLVFDAVAKGIAPVRAFRDEYEALSMQEWDDAVQHRLDELHHLIEAHHGWAWEQKIEVTLNKLHLDGSRRISELSGGTKKRVALAQALVTEPEVLLLDEPTNHLDLDSIEWLEQFLIEIGSSIIFITHDRAFLDTVATRIVELDRGILRSYAGNFSNYLLIKEKQLEDEALLNARADKLLAQEEVWIRQGVEARRTRSVARISRLEDLRQTRAQRRDAVGQVKLDISSGQRSGKIVAVLEDVDLSFGEKVIIKGFTSTLLRGDKIGILGPNGAGKSTLLKVILGVLQPQSGVVKLGTQIEVAYFDQMRESLDLESNLEDFISPGSEWVEISGQRKHVKSYLNDFLFSPERARSPIKSLSGGERNRLLLARLFAKPANVLVLDEPTNDLDIDTLDLLEEFLQNYSGTVFLVSHDRQFLDHVVTSMIAFEGDGIWREYEGGYEDWKIQNQRRLDYANKQSVIDNKSIKSVENKKELKVSKETQATKKTASLSKWEKKELEELSERIDFLEKQQVLLSEKLSDPSIYSSGNEKMGELKKQIIETDEELGRINIRWELLMERNTL